MTFNLTAGAFVHPNSPAFSPTATFFSYPIIALSGSRTFVNLGTEPASLTVNNLTGIGINRTIYMTFNPALDDAGFPDDPGYNYKFDFTGITILTNSTSLPVIRFVEVSTTTADAYTESQLDPTIWNPASFSLNACTQNYTVPVSSATGTNSGAVGDPSFTGFKGQTYQVHGMADTVYNVITDSLIQLNAYFVFLTEGLCPIVDGEKLANCWSHPGSYFGSLALQTSTGHKLLIASGPAKEGFTLTLNGSPLTSSTKVNGLSVAIVHSHRAIIEAGVYRLTVENSDKFINIVQAEVLDWAKLRRQVQSHGLLGQTWESNGKQIVEGSVDDYAEADNEMFGNKFLYNKFQL
jgi:hypothetical protein